MRCLFLFFNVNKNIFLQSLLSLSVCFYFLSEKKKMYYLFLTLVPSVVRLLLYLFHFISFFYSAAIEQR